MQKDQILDGIKTSTFTDKGTGMPIINIAFTTEYMAEMMVLIENTEYWNHITFFPNKDKNGKIYYKVKNNTYCPKNKRIIVKEK